MGFKIGDIFIPMVSEDGGGGFSLGLLSMGPIGFTNPGGFGGAFDLMGGIGATTNDVIAGNYDGFDFLDSVIDVVGQHPDEYEIQVPSDANGNTAGVTLYDYWNGTASSYFYTNPDNYFSRDFDVDPGNFDHYNPRQDSGAPEYEIF